MTTRGEPTPGVEDGGVISGPEFELTGGTGTVESPYQKPALASKQQSKQTAQQREQQRQQAEQQAQAQQSEAK